VNIVKDFGTLAMFFLVVHLPEMIRQVVNIIMGMLYSGMGIFVIWKEWFLTELDPIAAKALGILFIIYGIFRIYRAIKAIRTKDF